MGRYDKLHRANQKRKELSNKRWRERQDQLFEMYWIHGLTQKEIGRHFNVSQRTIGRVLAQLGIPIRRRGNFGERNGRFVDGSQSRLYRKIMVKRQCADCGGQENLVIHHKDYDHYNNAAENLAVLCVSCHLSWHKQAYWEALRKGEQPRLSNGPVGW